MPEPAFKVALPLSETLYEPREDEVTLLKKLTGIWDDVELKQHILQVQAEAYAVYPYPCIRSFSFTRFKIARYPDYPSVLKLGKERPGAILLDLACCFGNDSRKAVADGYPVANVITSDLRSEYWELGHKLYKTNKETYPVPFLGGDIFDPSFLSTDSSPARTAAVPLDAPPVLSTLTSLTPLQHHISVIHTASFFHLFNEELQHKLAHLLGSLLSPLPGSIILGSHGGSDNTEENRKGSTRLTGRGVEVFAHSPASWKELWVGKNGVFAPEQAIVRTIVIEIERSDITLANGLQGTYIAHWHIWSITRI